jgi:vWA-MoxR associated protein C-terminal domain
VGCSRFKPLLDKDVEEDGILCEQNQLPNEFSYLLKKAVALLRRGKFHLTIEFFLPIDLMYLEVDRWKIKINDSDELILGTRYPVRLRSIERLKTSYLDHNWPQWCENWEKVRDVLKNHPADDFFEHLEQTNDLDKGRLTCRLNEKIGLKVTCSNAQLTIEDWLTSVRSAATPIAIWIRSGTFNLDRVTEIDRALTLQPLCELCKSVQKIRVQAHTQTEEHLGFHLALLWENPYRLTPPAMIALREAGQ